MGGTGRLAWRDGCASRGDEAADDERHGGGGSRFWPGEATTHHDIHAVGRATVEANVCGDCAALARETADVTGD